MSELQTGVRGRGLLVLLIALPLGLISFLLLAIDRGEDFLTFGILAIVFLSLAAMFVISNGTFTAQWCTAPNFMTLTAALEFVIVPFIRFCTGEDQVDSYYLRALALILIGFGVFWAACLLLRRPYRFEFKPEFGTVVPRIHFAAIVLFVIGALANLLLWKLGILGYGSSDVKTATGTSNVGVLVAFGRMLTISMLISAIEVFGKRSRSLLMQFILAASALLSLGFGLVSGMKIEVLMPLFALALVLGITQRTIPKLLWTLPVLLLLLQPFVNAYRNTLNSGYSAQINTIGGLTSAFSKSLRDMTSANQSQLTFVSESNIRHFGSRLSDIGLFHSVLQLPSPDLLNGDETIWLAPIYPLIPRPLWPGKPTFNKGQRMSEALGYGINNSTNVPGVADLYVIGGTGGILTGMLLWGVVLQIYMNNIGAGLSERGTFIYVSMLFALTNIERDMVSLIGGAVEGIIVALILSRIVYGGRFFSMRAKSPVTR